MLVCTPRSLFSRSFEVTGCEDVRDVTLDFDVFTEQGYIQFGNERFRIKKHGFTSGTWTLEKNGEPIARARKISAFTRTFIIRDKASEITMEARSAFTREFRLRLDDQPIGSIRPVHAFTRATQIECPAEIPELTRLFCFWLAVLTRRRRSRDAAANP